MHRILLLLVAGLLNLAAFAQVGTTTLTLTDPARNNRQIPLNIFYPSASTGADAAPASGVYPVIAFGHGFVMQPTEYGTLGEGLAAAGYVVAFVGTETGFSPNHAEMGLDLLFTAAQLPVLSAQPGSLLSGHILPRRAIAGHSMGGGATWLAAAAAASSGTPLDCIAGLAPAETNPSAIAAAATVAVPALVLSGDADAVTPPAEHHLPIYNGTAAPCRAFVSIGEGSHCGYADGGGLCDLGELFFNGLDRPTQTALTIDLLTAWFDFHLKDDEEAWPAFASYDASSPHTSTTIDCASDLAAHPTSSLLPAAYPNPFRDVLHLAPCPSLLQSATLYALSSNQVSVLTAAPAFVAPIDWILDPTLPAGTYVLQRMCGTSVTRQVVVKMNCEY
jgi:pimeloyl-ACP methyl ester carboxylesterase